MTGTFGSLNIAKTGLQYQQVAIDVADNNIANVNTDGYVRRRATAAEVGGPDQPVMWSTYTGQGEGVTTQGVQRLTDILLDKRVRTEHGNLSYLQAQQTSMERVESAINEPSDNGVSAAISNFASAWQDVVSATNGTAARASVISSGQTLAAAIQNQARSLDAESDEQRAGALQDVTSINQDAQQMAQLNHAISLAQANGADVGDLQDQRDQLALDLANKAGAVTTADATTGKYNVTIGGVSLVQADSYGAIQVNGINPDGTTSAASGAQNTVSFTATDLVPYTGTPDLSTADPADPARQVSPGGDLGGVTVLLNSTLPSYRQQLNDLASNIATVVNAQHRAGYDESGNPGTDFFSISAGDPAGSIAVAITDPTFVAAASTKATDTSGTTTGGTADGSNADLISQVLTGAPLGATAGPAGDGKVTDATTGASVSSINISDEYQRMITGLGSTVSALNTQTTNQQLLANQVDDQREQSAGVSLDEETINLMQAQRAYQASSRVLSVMDSVLDTLINHTGA